MRICIPIKTTDAVAIVSAFRRGRREAQDPSRYFGVEPFAPGGAFLVVDPETRACETCGKTFVVTDGRQRFCPRTYENGLPMVIPGKRTRSLCEQRGRRKREAAR